jgi:hypothetical protein
MMLEAQTLVKANPYGAHTKAPTLGIVSPQARWWNAHYSNASIPLKIGVLVLQTNVAGVYTPQIDNISYSLDSEEYITLTNLTREDVFSPDPRQQTVSFTVSATLYNLSEGDHALRAYSSGSDGKVLSDEIIFTVDSSYRSPQFTLVSPKNTTYTTNQVQLILSTNKELKSAKYYLDFDQGAHSITVNGNTTLTLLTEGTHKIMVIANCPDKYHYSTQLYQGTTFTVDTTKTGTPLTLGNAAMASVIVIVTIASFTLVYFKKRSKSRSVA